MDLDEALVDACAQCGTSSSAANVMAADELEFQVNKTCGHKFCKNCLNDIFTNQGKRQFSCAACFKAGRQVMVKREKLSKKSLESLEVDKDIRIRRKIKSIFNQTVNDFQTLEDFNNYEEEVEDIIFNLVHDLRVDEMKAKIDRYQKENEVEIALNQGKAFEEDSRIERQVQQERQALELKLQEQKIAERQERTFKAERHRQLNELALGERDRITIKRGGAADSDADASANASQGAISAQQKLALQQFSSHSALLKGIEQRNLPKLISLPKTKADKLDAEKALSREERLFMHSAAGYSHSIWFKKSWEEGMPRECVPQVNFF